MKTCAPTEIETHNVGSDFAVTSPSAPRSSTTPFSPTAVWARRVRYGPNNAPATVVEKAELAQSYIFQPKISRRSFLSVADVAGASVLADVVMKEPTLAIKIELVVECLETDA